jgi:hypothetical protein
LWGSASQKQTGEACGIGQPEGRTNVAWVSPVGAKQPERVPLAGSLYFVVLQLAHEDGLE